MEAESSSLEEKVRKIIGYRVNFYIENRDRGEVSLEVEAGEVTFDKLAALSELFQTKKINIGGRTSDSGCSSCGYYDTMEVAIDIFDANFGEN